MARSPESSVEARLQLSSLLLSLGRPKEAEDTLEVEPFGASAGAGEEGARVEVLLARAALRRSQGSQDAFLELALPLVRQTLLADLENVAAQRQFREAHPSWRPWMATLRRSLHSEARAAEDDAQGPGASSLYHGLSSGLPRGIQ